MDGRREPRFQIYAPAKLALLDTPERELECRLLDISATGLKVVMDESLQVDELITLEVEDHLVLADVRYAEPRGDKFAIGAERIHAVAKAALPQEKTRAEQIRFVVDDYRSRIRLAIVGEPAQVEKQEPDLPLQHRDQVVEAAVQKLTEKWAKESAGATAEEPLRAAIVERASLPVTDRTPPPAPITSPPRRLSWRLPIAIAGTIAMMAFTGSLFLSYRHSVAGNAPQKAVAEAKAEPSPSPVVVAARRHAEIRVTEPAWVYVVSDGREVFRKLLVKDETRQIDFVQRALVRVGNAGGVEISVDGKPVGPLGSRGEIRALEITAAGHRFVPASAVTPEKN